MCVVEPVELPQELPWRKVLPRPRLCSRDAFLLKLAEGKRVLHVGAADAPLTHEKYQAGELLHIKLRAVAGHLVGIDIDQEAVGYLQNQTGVDDIVVADLIQDGATHHDERLTGPFDLIYCCDIIEHVDNPGMLLENMRRYSQPETRIVVTTPNALSIKGALRPMLLGKEFSHPDHVSYFSFSTLAELMRRHRIEPVGYGVYDYHTPNPVAGLLFKLVYHLSPNSAEGFFLIGKPVD